MTAADYQGAKLNGDPADNVIAWVCDPAGHVTRVLVTSWMTAEQRNAHGVPEKDTGFLQAVGEPYRQYPFDPRDVEMHGVPCDAEGRGLSVLEMEHRERTARAAA